MRIFLISLCLMFAGCQKGCDDKQPTPPPSVPDPTVQPTPPPTQPETPTPTQPETPTPTPEKEK